jgi:hypothetical protein
VAAYAGLGRVPGGQIPSAPVILDLVVDLRLHRATTGENINSRGERTLKFVCLGYIEEKEWEGVSEDERNAMMDECFAYDDVLRRNGHFAGGEALQGAQSAATLRYQTGKVMVTDGPYAETKEQLGGILILEADDLSHAIELMSKHPGVKAGPFEIRPAADLAEFIRESERRRSATTG